MARKRGRPTKYKPSLIKKVDEYLEMKQDEYYEFHKTRGARTDSFEQKIRVNLPMIEDFATYIDVNQDTLYEWSSKYPKFSEALDKIRKEQKKRLLEKSLSGQYNSTIAKLVLSANHGMKEQTGIDHTTNGKDLPSTIQVEFVNYSDEE